MTITYTKLQNGDWGLRSDEDLINGQTVTVTKKNGEQKEEIVGEKITTLKYSIQRSAEQLLVPMYGQIWDECERCGREPVYLPLYLCERCWPKK